MVKTDPRLMAHGYEQSNTPSKNSEENHAFSRPQPSTFNLPQQTRNIATLHIEDISGIAAPLPAATNVQ